MKGKTQGLYFPIPTAGHNDDFLLTYRFVKMVDLMLKFLREIKNESPRKLLDVQMGWYHRLLHMFELIKLRT